MGGEAKSSGTFWYELDSLATSAEFLRISALASKEVYFVTAREGYRRKRQTDLWLRVHGVTSPTVVICKKKGEFCKAAEIDYAIDDKASNASFIDWATEGRTKSYLLDRPYNRVPEDFLASGVQRVPGITHFWEDIQMATGTVIMFPPQDGEGPDAKPDTKPFLPPDAESRKKIPLCTGLLDYFPNALREVAIVSYHGNQQHNPGQPMHWARGKSVDHEDCILRHTMERGTLDVDGMRHTAKRGVITKSGV